MADGIYRSTSWSPVYKEPASATESGLPSSNRQADVHYQSYLRQQVAVREEELKLTTLNPKSETDQEVVKRMTNSSLHHCFARSGDLIFIGILVALIVLIVFLGTFFTFFY